MTTPAPALCSLCQKSGQPNPDCPACKHLRETQRGLATAHSAADLMMPSTFTAVESKAGTIVLQRKNDPVIAGIFIGLGLFMIGVMIIVFVASGAETLAFAIPLVLVSLGGIGLGIRSLRYRQLVSLERGVLTVSDNRSAKGAVTARDIEQLAISATHVTYWHKGLRWGARYELHAQTSSGNVVVMSGLLEEVRFVEATFERALRIDDEPARNIVTVAGH